MIEILNVAQGVPYDENWLPINTTGKNCFCAGDKFYIFADAAEYEAWKAINYPDDPPPTEDGEQPNSDQ